MATSTSSPDIDAAAVQALAERIAYHGSRTGWNEQNLIEHARIFGRALRAGLEELKSEPGNSPSAP